MKTPTLRWRRPPEERELATKVDTESATEDGGPDVAMEWTGPSAALTKALTYGLVACLVAGPVALILTLGQAAQPAPAAPASAVVDDTSKSADERAAVADFATAFVQAWLTTPSGEEERLARFVAATGGVTLPETPWQATEPALAGITKTPEGTWSVVVSIAVTEPAPASGTKAAGTVQVRRYFRVPVTYRDGSLIAQALPAPVPAPTTAAQVSLGYVDHASSVDPIAVTLEEFLNALLAGGGDVTRYTSPGAPITAVSPAPYTSVDLDDVLVDRKLDDVDQANPATDTQLRVLLSATAAANGKQEITVQYALTLTARDARWEVTSIDPAPIADTSTTEEPAPGSETSADPSTSTPPASTATDPTTTTE